MVRDRATGARWLACGMLSALLLILPAQGRASDSDILARLDSEQRRNYEAYRTARLMFDNELERYWSEVDAKRAERRRKRRAGEPFARHDYVLEQPPNYAGPPLRPDISRIIAAAKPPEREPPLPTISDFLRNAKEHFGFVPQTVGEREFKRRYAEEAIALGLTKEQVVRIYALETGGRGTH